MDSTRSPSHKALRILVIAESANPDWVSVPLVGWSHYQAISTLVDSHLVTQIRNQSAIEKYGLKPGVEFTAIDTETIARPFHRLSLFLRGKAQLSWSISTAIASLTYPYFEYKVWKSFKQRLLSGEFDLVHRLTPLSPTAPSFIAGRLKKAGIPLVIGPLNGGLKWPSGFESFRKREREWLHHFRFLHRFLPWQQSGKTNASAILCGSMATYSDLVRELGADAEEKLLYIPENGIDPSRFEISKVGIKSTSAPLRIAFVGRLVPYKGCDILLRATAALLDHGKVEIDIIGDGPEMPRLRKIASEVAMTYGNIRFHGWVEHQKVQDILRDSDVLALPSVREFGGGVVLEAMALGVVPVVANYGGPAELVNGGCGFKLDVASPQALEKDLEHRLSQLSEHREMLIEMASNAVQQILDWHLWEKKAESMVAVYHWVLGHREKPRLRLPEDAQLRTSTAQVATAQTTT